MIIEELTPQDLGLTHTVGVDMSMSRKMTREERGITEEGLRAATKMFEALKGTEGEFVTEVLDTDGERVTEEALNWRVVSTV